MEQDIIIKFCVVGEPSVGKTSMLYQYVHHKFDQKIRPTIGCDFTTKLKSSIDNKPVRLQLWDIAGQQRFNAVSKMYLRGALGNQFISTSIIGCLIVCSSTDSTTIDETLKWKRIIEENSDYGNQTNIPCLLVQNKSDLIIGQSQVEEYQKKEYLENFAKKNGFCGVVQCSAKTNLNVQQCFQSLLDETIKRGLVKGNSFRAMETGRQTITRKQKNIRLTNQNAVDVEKKKSCC